MGLPYARHRVARLAGAAVLVTATALPAPAQTSWLALETVVAVDGDAGSQVVRKPTGWFDLFADARMAEGLSARIRPIVFRRSFDGDWQTQIYEMALRYEHPGRVGWRLDAGVIPSPIGLSILENRPDLGPVVSPHSTLYLPVPEYEAGSPGTTLVAAAYPTGAQVTVSGLKWDARAALIDTSPVRARLLLGEGRPPRMANWVVGGGVTPRTGLRIGATVGRGPWARQWEVRDGTKGDRSARVVQVESEWSFGYTRIAGEFLWTWRETAVDGAQVRGGWVEATQTLTPRWFAAMRYDRQHCWALQPAGGASSDTYRRVETAVGFRVTPDVTLRASYMTRKGYVVRFWDDQVLASIVFARRLR